MNRDDLEFSVTYSFYLEKMNYRLLTRIDKLITLTLIALGFAVFAKFSNMFFFGAVVAVLSVLQLVYQFAQEAGASKEQMRHYRSLMVNMKNIGDEELRQRFAKIQDSDSMPWQSLEDAAYNRTLIVLGHTGSLTKLSAKDSVLSWLAGDLPKN